MFMSAYQRKAQYREKGTFAFFPSAAFVHCPLGYPRTEKCVII